MEGITRGKAATAVMIAQECKEPIAGCAGWRPMDVAGPLESVE